MATIIGMNALGQTVTHAVDDALIAQRAAASAKRRLTSYIGERANKQRAGGITVSGISVGTDALGIAYITGAANKARADGAFTTQFVLSPTHAVTLDAAALLGIEAATQAFIAASFAAEANANAELQSGSITDHAGVDAIFSAVQKAF